MKKYYMMDKHYMIFNGIRSNELGLIVKNMPNITRAGERIKKIEIPGRSGTLHEQEGTYSNYTMSVELLITEIEEIDRICQLFKGTGEVVFSNDLNRKYRVTVVNQIDIAYIAPQFKSFILQLDTYPFKYSADSLNDHMELTKEQVFFNPGTVHAEPIIKITGSGNVTLDINGKFYGVYPVDGSVTINSEMMEVYKDAQNKNNTFVADDFPTFNPGENKISWTGHVTKIEIEPNWRWL